ncbi:hypothetical protein C1N32_05480 [Vibrio diazotrophicus]|uniref:Uncharacterized protein n=1 Tax=Vibrio diazotrophicus TaxID=685 RepID=A0A2J8I4Y5_VIBDI|nr:MULTISPECIES: hypothetical protein [Vibrio]MCF7361902.1 hypothetical protein [Vibrio sp. A1-b2]PNI05554.1 hypothetical protein C1N32_05480 [Vibrio diazotrophicus]
MNIYRRQKGSAGIIFALVLPFIVVITVLAVQLSQRAQVHARALEAVEVASLAIVASPKVSDIANNAYANLLVDSYIIDNDGAIRVNVSHVECLIEDGCSSPFSDYEVSATSNYHSWVSYSSMGLEPQFDIDSVAAARQYQGSPQDIYFIVGFNGSMESWVQDELGNEIVEYNSYRAIADIVDRVNDYHTSTNDNYSRISVIGYSIGGVMTKEFGRTTGDFYGLPYSWGNYKIFSHLTSSNNGTTFTTSGDYWGLRKFLDDIKKLDYVVISSPFDDPIITSQTPIIDDDTTMEQFLNMDRAHEFFFERPNYGANYTALALTNNGLEISSYLTDFRNRFVGYSGGYSAEGVIHAAYKAYKEEDINAEQVFILFEPSIGYSGGDSGSLPLYNSGLCEKLRNEIAQKANREHSERTKVKMMAFYNPFISEPMPGVFYQHNLDSYENCFSEGVYEFDYVDNVYNKIITLINDDNLNKGRLRN